jgi:predicted ferric reductase
MAPRSSQYNFQVQPIQDDISDYGSIITTITGQTMQSLTPSPIIINDRQRCLSLERLRDNMAFMVAAGGMIVYCVYIALGQKEPLTFTLLTISSLCCLISIPVFRPDYTSSLADLKLMNMNRCQRFFTGGDVNITIVSLIFVAIPCFWNICKAFRGHLMNSDGHFEFTFTTHVHLANDLGKLAVYAMSFFLIPVSQQSILLKSLQINPSHAVKLHTFAGYISLGGGLSHGLYWVWIWFFVINQSISNILPGAGCWHWGDEGGACRRQFVNATGLFCGMCFIMLGLSSMWWVRRNHYRVFYICHAVFSVAILFGLLMHYNKMIWYLASSIIYYFALSTPVLVKSIQNYMEGGTLMINAAAIPDSRGCVEMTFKYSEHRSKAMEALRLTCGSYVRLKVPEISSIWHPFTVFASASTPDELRIIFRVSGSFTTNLSNRLAGSTSTRHQYPKVLVDGMYGNQNQLKHAFSHETVFIVAGGVGIVTYISLLQSILVDRSFGEADHLTPGMLPKQIVVHWICRDEGLINYITDRYFSGDCDRPQLQIIIHHTTPENSGLTLEQDSINDDMNPSPDAFVDHQRAVQGKPFIPTMPGSIVQNVLLFVNFSTIGWGSLYLVHYSYDNYQSGQTVYLSLVVFAILLLAIVCSTFIALIAKLLFSCIESDPSYSMIESQSKKDSFATSTDVSSDDMDAESGSSQLQIEHCLGRPSTQDIVEKAFDSSDNVGIFVCGPTMLHQGIRTSVSKTVGIPCLSTRISIYEEVFEL